MRRVSYLLPLLVIYVIMVLLYSHTTPNLRVDENRYIADANFIKDGKYPPGPPRGIWNGPGYPIILTPFVALDLPWLAARLANAILLLVAFVYLCRLLETYVAARWAYVAAYCVGLWPVLLEYMPRLMTEPLSILLVCGFAFHFTRIYRNESGRWRNIILAGAYLGYLALTKVLFGYVIAAGILIYGVYLVITRKPAVLRSLLVYGLAMVVCLPYLWATHARTGKVFFWSNSGGLSLYWMSTPYEGEYGDWLAGTKPWLKKQKAGNHLDFLETLRGLDPFEKDEALRKQAVSNIVGHPGKFAKNWVANLGRLFGEYPYSYESPASITYVKLIFGMLLLVLSALSLIRIRLKRRRIPYEVGALSVFGLIYVGGSSLLSAYNRMLLPALPLFALWVCFAIGEPGLFRPNRP